MGNAEYMGTSRKQTFSKMVDVSDEAITEAYHSVRDDNTAVDWFLAGYSDDGKALRLVGGHFEDDQPMYGYLRVTVGDDESIRQKFVLVTWCGPAVKALKKAKMSVHKASFKEVVREFAIEMHYTEHNEVDAAEIRARVIAAGGANYSQKY